MADLLRALTRKAYTISHTAIRPAVFQTAASGDPVAVGIVSTFGRELGLLATNLVRRFALEGTAPFVVASGSLVHPDGAAALRCLSTGSSASRGRERAGQVEPASARRGRGSRRLAVVGRAYERGLGVGELVVRGGARRLSGESTLRSLGRLTITPTRTEGLPGRRVGRPRAPRGIEGPHEPKALVWSGRGRVCPGLPGVRLDHAESRLCTGGLRLRRSSATTLGATLNAGDAADGDDSGDDAAGDDGGAVYGNCPDTCPDPGTNCCLVNVDAAAGPLGTCQDAQRLLRGRGAFIACGMTPDPGDCPTAGSTTCCLSFSDAGGYRAVLRRSPRPAPRTRATPTRARARRRAAGPARRSRVHSPASRTGRVRAVPRCRVILP